MTGEAAVVVVLAAALGAWVGHEVGWRRGWEAAATHAIDMLRRGRLAGWPPTARPLPPPPPRRPS